MNIFETLKEDHNKVRELYKEIISIDPSKVEQRQEVFKSLKTEIVLHNEAEEETFYSPLNEYEQMESLLEDAQYDHQQAEALLAELDAIPVDQEDFEDKLDMLMELLNEHIEEEEGEIFDKARKALDEKQQEEMKTNFVRLKEKKKQTLQKIEEDLKGG